MSMPLKKNRRHFADQGCKSISGKWTNLFLQGVITALALLFSNCHGNTDEKKIGDDKHKVDVHAVISPADSNAASQVKTVKPEMRSLSQTVEARGSIDYDTRTFNTISSRYSGRIEKMYVKYPYQEIHKGEVLFEIYSPDVTNAEQHYLFLVNHDSLDKELVQASRQKLLHLGLTEAQIQKLVKTKNPDQLLAVYSPYDGHIHEMKPQMMGDIEGVNKNFSETELTLKEGTYVEKGEPLYNVVDAHRVWALLKIYQEDIPKIKLHQPLEVSFDDQVFSVNAQVDFIEPQFGADNKTATIRVYLDNQMHMLKVGSRVTARVVVDSVKGWWIPSSAVMDLGRDKIVFLKQGNSFVAHRVETGEVIGNDIQIVDGLTPDNEVASNAGFLVDSESFIKKNWK